MHSHVVFFWLKEPANLDHQRLFSDGLAHLAKDPRVKEAKVGRPASTSREVVENGYDFGLIFSFETLADHNAYQAGQHHSEFLDRCQNLWSRVQVYDLED